MPQRRKVHIATVRGRCASCHAESDLSLSEIRPQRRVIDLLRRDIDLRVDRRVTCSECDHTYTVRAEDASAIASRARHRSD
jgi:hypothetical protein